MSQHPIISGLMAIFVVGIVVILLTTLIFLILEIIDKLCCKLCFIKLYYFCKDKKNGVKVAPEIKIVEAKITILPVTVYAREIIIGDALEACEV